MIGHVTVLKEHANGGVANQDQPDAGGQTLEKRRLDAAAQDRAEAPAVGIQRVGTEAGKDRRRQGNGKNAQGKLIEKLRPVEPRRRA